MGKKSDRINRIIEILKERNYVSIKELSSILHVSEMTIRRDLAILKNHKIAENMFGTTFYSGDKTNDENDYNLSTENCKQYSEKERISRLAASMIEQGDIVIIDTGTTTERLVPFIPDNLDITVLCYNINILMQLYQNGNIKMIFSGGYYHPNTQMFESPEGIRLINGIRANKVFISAAGVHSELGLTCANSYEVPTKQAVLKSSLDKILLVDSSKFNKVRSSYFCSLDQITAIITDSGISDEWKNIIEEKGIKLFIA